MQKDFESAIINANNKIHSSLKEDELYGITTITIALSCNKCLCIGHVGIAVHIELEKSY